MGEAETSIYGSVIMNSLTYAKLKISIESYTEIRVKLLDANYQHVFRDLGSPSETIILGEVGLVPEKGCSMPSHHWDCNCNGMGGDR